MTVTVKFFARLREDMNIENMSLDIPVPTDARSVWAAATGRKMPEYDIFCAINQAHAHLDHMVNDGDEVAFFPQITGG